MKRQVIKRIIRGNINKQIARTLGATERTIKVHRQRVMEKMQVRTLAGTCVACRAGRRCVGYRTDSLGLFSNLKVLHEVAFPSLEPQGIDLRQSR